jgi:hypothetical protein
LFLELPLVAAATTIPLLVVPKPPVLIKVPVFRLAEPFQTILTSVFVLENHQNIKTVSFPYKSQRLEAAEWLPAALSRRGQNLRPRPGKNGL